jgi:PAS domain S-box-containing protein
MQELLLRHGPTALAVLDRELRFLRVSAGFAELLGVPVGDHIGRPVSDLVPGRSLRPYVPAVQRAMAGEPVVGLRLAALWRPGPARHLEVSLYPEVDGAGEVMAIGVVVSDVNDRMAVELALEEREATLRLVLDSAPNAMLVVSEHGTIVGRNREAERLFGYEEGELAGLPVDELVPLRSRGHHPELRGTFHRNPRTRLMGHGRDLVARRKDGSEFPVEVGLGASVDRPGLVTCVVTDLTERRRSDEERTAMLAATEAARADAEAAKARLTALQHISDAGLAHLTLDALLRELVGRVMRIFSVEVSTILLLDETGGALVPTASLGLEDGIDADVRVPLGSGIVGKVAATRRPLVVNGIASDEVHSEVFRRSGLRSVMAAPLIVDGELLGVQHVGCRSERTFTDADAEMLGLIAERVALAVERARAYGREHTIAETLQQSLLPERLPPVERMTVAVRYRAGAAGTKVGGDWYDVVPLGPTRTGFVIGDVMGQGVRAAAVTGQLRHTARALLRLSPSLGEAAEHLNAIVWGLGPDELTTVVLAHVDTDEGTLTWVSAGHLPPVVRRADGTVAPLDQDANVPLGAVDRWTYAARTVDVGAGDTLLLYTDGLVERRDSSVGEGISRLAGWLGANGDGHPAQLAQDAFSDLLVDGVADDDVAVLIARVDEVAPASPRLEVPAEADSLRAIRDRLGTWLVEVGADEVERHELLAAVTEALTHTVPPLHDGRAPHAPATWTVAGRLIGEEVCITVGDQLAQGPPATSDRGRGLVMMEAFVDELTIRRSVEGGKVHLHRRLGRPQHGPAGLG